MHKHDASCVDPPIVHDIDVRPGRECLLRSALLYFSILSSDPAIVDWRVPHGICRMPLQSRRRSDIRTQTSTSYFFRPSVVGRCLHKRVSVSFLSFQSLEVLVACVNVWLEDLRLPNYEAGAFIKPPALVITFYVEWSVI